jgi:hypothetical protein
MTLLITVAVVLAIAGFVLGWLRGYKKACDAHGWNLQTTASAIEGAR